MELPQQQHRHHRKQNNLHREEQSPQSKCLCAPGTGQILLWLTQGCDCSVPTSFSYSFCKGPRRQCKSFSKYAQFGGFHCSQRQESDSLHGVSSSQVWHQECPCESTGIHSEMVHEDKGHQRIRNMGNPSCFPLKDSDSACKR